MSIAVKLCGITTKQAADATVALGAEYVGFVFYPPSPRNVSPKQAAALKPNGIKTVAVTVNPDDALLSEIVATLKPDYIQLHGKESPERVREVKARYGIPVIKAISVRNADDVANAMAYSTSADMLMFDAKAPETALPGGNGLAFDWKLLAGKTFPLPWFLSGGLNAENVGEALKLSGARMVDVSSSIESEPGVKDIARMREFVESIRHHEK